MRSDWLSLFFLSFGACSLRAAGKVLLRLLQVFQGFSPVWLRSLPDCLFWQMYFNGTQPHELIRKETRF
jgi:hypothetical protein